MQGRNDVFGEKHMHNGPRFSRGLEAEGDDLCARGVDNEVCRPATRRRSAQWGRVVDFCGFDQGLTKCAPVRTLEW